MDELIYAGVVTFNPDLPLLLASLEAVSTQVERVLVFDNGSANIDALAQHLASFPNVDLIRSEYNQGVAYALNRLAADSLRNDARWLLTLDQDSLTSSGMVECLRSFADTSTALVTPFIVDRNKMSVADFESLALPSVQYLRQAARRGAITSGALMNLGVWREVGGFDSRLFIDYVDYDFNQRVLLAGYRIAKVNTTYLLHAVGRARKTWLCTPRRSVDGHWEWERFYSFNHSPLRCYYKARNRVLFTRKYWRCIGVSHEGIFQIPPQVALTVLFEERKVAKLRAFARGLVDGLRLPSSQTTWNKRAIALLAQRNVRP